MMDYLMRSLSSPTSQWCQMTDWPLSHLSAVKWLTDHSHTSVVSNDRLTALTPQWCQMTDWPLSHLSGVKWRTDHSHTSVVSNDRLTTLTPLIQHYCEHGFPRSFLEQFTDQCTDAPKALFRSSSNTQTDNSWRSTCGGCLHSCMPFLRKR